jgi:hypothetical protein
MNAGLSNLSVTSLAIAPSNPEILDATSYSYAMMADPLAMFTKASMAACIGFRSRKTSITPGAISVVIDPSDPTKVYLGTGNGVYKKHRRGGELGFG